MNRYPLTVWNDLVINVPFTDLPLLPLHSDFIPLLEHLRHPGNEVSVPVRNLPHAYESRFLQLFNSDTKSLYYQSSPSSEKIKLNRTDTFPLKNETGRLIFRNNKTNYKVPQNAGNNASFP